MPRPPPEIDVPGVGEPSPPSSSWPPDAAVASRRTRRRRKQPRVRPTRQRPRRRPAQPRAPEAPKPADTPSAATTRSRTADPRSTSRRRPLRPPVASNHGPARRRRAWTCTTRRSSPPSARCAALWRPGATVAATGCSPPTSSARRSCSTRRASLAALDRHGHHIQRRLHGLDDEAARGRRLPGRHAHHSGRLQGLLGARRQAGEQGQLGRRESDPWRHQGLERTEGWGYHRGRRPQGRRRPYVGDRD